LKALFAVMMAARRVEGSKQHKGAQQRAAGGPTCSDVGWRGMSRFRFVVMGVRVVVMNMRMCGAVVQMMRERDMQ